jgi:hypothetical protein
MVGRSFPETGPQAAWLARQSLLRARRFGRQFCVNDGHSLGRLEVKQGFRNWRIIEPIGEMEFDADSAFVTHYNANEFTGFGCDFK